jgi:hypothetical protein
VVLSTIPLRAIVHSLFMGDNGAAGLRSFPRVGGLRCHRPPSGYPPTYIRKCTTSVVRGHPPTYRKVLHPVNLVLNLVLRSMLTKFRPSLSHPHRSAYAKYRFSVTPGTGTCSKLFNQKTKKLTEPYCSSGSVTEVYLLFKF